MSAAIFGSLSIVGDPSKAYGDVDAPCYSTSTELLYLLFFRIGDAGIVLDSWGSLKTSFSSLSFSSC